MSTARQGAPIAVAVLLVCCGGEAVVDDVTMGTGGTGGSSSTSSTSSTSGTGGGFTDPVPDVVTDSCPEAAAWDTVCMTIAHNTVYAFELESLTTCAIVTFGGPLLSEANGLALIGDHIHLCASPGDAGESGLYRIHLSSGLVELAKLWWCDSVTEYQGQLLVTSYEQTLETYPSYDELLWGTASGTPLPFQAEGSCISALGDTLHTALDLASEVERYALPSGSPHTTVPLEGFYNFIVGMAETTDGRLAILSYYDLYLFSLDGALLDIRPPPVEFPYGLRCWADPVP